MSADLLREAAAKMRERAEAAALTEVWRGDESDETTPEDGPFVHHVSTFANPAVALAVAKAMDDVAHAWEIADEASDGYVYDADDNHWRFEETVDGGWLDVARAYLGSDQ